MITFTYRDIGLWRDSNHQIPSPFTVSTEEELLVKLIEQRPFLKDEKYPLRVSGDVVMGWSAVGFIKETKHELV